MTEHIIKTKKGYTFDRDEVFSAKEIIFGNKAPARGTVGYFGDSLNELCNMIDVGNSQELHHCEIDCIPFYQSESYNFAFFLPVSAVIAPKAEKKYRAFRTVQEFVTSVQIYQICGGVYCVYMRRKGYQNVMLRAINGFNEMADGTLDQVFLGAGCHSPVELLQSFEWRSLVNGKWLPFGLEETK